MMELRKNVILRSPQRGRLEGRKAPRSPVLISNFYDLDRLGPGRGAQLDDVALMRLQQRPGDRRNPADLAAVEVGLVDADDRHGLLGALPVGEGHARPEEYLVAPGLLARVDNLGALQPLGEEADAPVDLAQPLLAVEVVAVFGAVAIAGRPGDDVDGFRALLAAEAAQLLLHAAMALRRHVIPHPHGDGGRLVGQLRLVVGFLDECLAHHTTFSARNAAISAAP